MKKADLIFSIAMVGIISVGLATAVLSKDTINEYENRYINSADSFTLSGYVDGSFQESIEPMLADKINFAIPMKKAYNNLNSAFLKKSVALTVGERSDRYVNMGDLSLFGDYIVREIFTLDEYGEAIEKNVQSYAELVAKNPDVDFYYYYIERDTDINFETGEKNGVYELICEKSGFPVENIARFEVTDFEGYKKNFYKTDHHWNAVGADKGYHELLNLLKLDDEPLAKGELVEIATFSGSKAVGATASYSEMFSAYKYSFPNITIISNGVAVSDYGNRDWYTTQPTDTVTYGDYYGGDIGELIFDAQNNDKDNLLVIGESYDNAILKLLATHFNKLYSIDLRYYEVSMGKKFDFASYVEENDIDKVLFIGSIGFVRSEDFIAR